MLVGFTIFGCFFNLYPSLVKKSGMLVEDSLDGEIRMGMRGDMMLISLQAELVVTLAVIEAINFQIYSAAADFKIEPAG